MILDLISLGQNYQEEDYLNDFYFDKGSNKTTGLKDKLESRV